MKIVWMDQWEHGDISKSGFLMKIPVLGLNPTNGPSSFYSDLIIMVIKRIKPSTEKNKGHHEIQEVLLISNF